MATALSINSALSDHAVAKGIIGLSSLSLSLTPTAGVIQNSSFGCRLADAVEKPLPVIPTVGRGRRVAANEGWFVLDNANAVNIL